jgi:hypothetical protein
MLVANVIFPAFHAPYVAWFFAVPLGLMVLAVEGLVLGASNRGAHPGIVAACVVGMNVASWFVGLFVTPYLLVGGGLEVDDQGLVRPGPGFARLCGEVFVQAGVLSVVVEGALLVATRRWTGLHRVWLPLAIGNAATYFVLALSSMGLHRS